MSHLPPDPWDDGPEPMRSNEWDPPTGAGANTKAAVLLWIIGALQTLMCGCCAGMFGVVGLLDLAELEQAAPQPLPPNFDQMHQMMPYIAGGIVLLGFVPGVIYLVLAFGVRRGHILSIRIAQILAMTQAIVLGMLAIRGIIASVSVGDPVSLTVTLIVFGTPLLLLGFAIRWLMATSRQ